MHERLVRDQEQPQTQDRTGDHSQAGSGSLDCGTKLCLRTGRTHEDTPCNFTVSQHLTGQCSSEKRSQCRQRYFRRGGFLAKRSAMPFSAEASLASGWAKDFFLQVGYAISAFGHFRWGLANETPLPDLALLARLQTTVPEVVAWWASPAFNRARPAIASRSLLN